MANAKNYRKLVIEGSTKYVRGFVDGVLAASGLAGEILWCDECGISPDASGSKLARLVHLAEQASAVVLDTRQHKALTTALMAADGRPIVVASDKEIGEASFEFHFEVFSRHYGDEIVKIFAQVPKGVSLQGYKPKETLDPEAEGVEARSAAHDYELRGSGTAKGPFDAIRILHARCLATDLVRESDIKLKLGRA